MHGLSTVKDNKEVWPLSFNFQDQIDIIHGLAMGDIVDLDQWDTVSYVSSFFCLDES